MNVMTAPDVWSGQDRALTVADMENVEPDRDKPELIAFELRDGQYQEVARVGGDEAFRAALPFPVTVTPSELVRAGR